jgi:hypothetical protein
MKNMNKNEWAELKARSRSAGVGNPPGKLKKSSLMAAYEWLSHAVQKSSTVMERKPLRLTKKR